MGKFLGVLTFTCALACALLVVSIMIGTWESMTAGANWGSVGILLLPALVLGVVGTALDKAARRAGWNTTLWKPIEKRQTAVQRRTSPKEGPRQARTIGIAGVNLAASDGMLNSYRNVEVDWYGRWVAAHGIKGDLPPFEHRPYWSPVGPGGRLVPLTVLAFWGAEDRLRIARDPDTIPEMLALMEDDPDPRVALAARR
jgi:hypothetical protein